MSDTQTAKITERELSKLYEEHFDKIYRFFYYKVQSTESAEDMTSETFMTFVRLVGENKEIENIKAFLYGIAKNVFLQFLKSKYREGIAFSVIDEDFEGQTSEFLEEVEECETPEETLLKFLDKLPEKQKEIIRLRFIDKLSLSDICAKMNKDMNYVKTTQKRGLKSLRKLVEVGTL